MTDYILVSSLAKMVEVLWIGSFICDKWNACIWWWPSCTMFAFCPVLYNFLLCRLLHVSRTFPLLFSCHLVLNWFVLFFLLCVFILQKLATFQVEEVSSVLWSPLVFSCIVRIKMHCFSHSFHFCMNSGSGFGYPQDSFCGLKNRSAMRIWHLSLLVIVLTNSWRENLNQIHGALFKLESRHSRWRWRLGWQAKNIKRDSPKMSPKRHMLLEELKQDHIFFCFRVEIDVLEEMKQEEDNTQGKNEKRPKSITANRKPKPVKEKDKDTAVKETNDKPKSDGKLTRDVIQSDPNKAEKSKFKSSQEVTADQGKEDKTAKDTDKVDKSASVKKKRLPFSFGRKSKKSAETKVLEKKKPENVQESSMWSFLCFSCAVFWTAEVCYFFVASLLGLLRAGILSSFPAGDLSVLGLSSGVPVFFFIVDNTVQWHPKLSCCSLWCHSSVNAVLFCTAQHKQQFVVQNLIRRQDRHKFVSHRDEFSYPLKSWKIGIEIAWGVSFYEGMLHLAWHLPECRVYSKSFQVDVQKTPDCSGSAHV